MNDASKIGYDKKLSALESLVSSLKYDAKNLSFYDEVKEIDITVIGGEPEENINLRLPFTNIGVGTYSVLYLLKFSAEPDSNKVKFYLSTSPGEAPDASFEFGGCRGWSATGQTSKYLSGSQEVAIVPDTELLFTGQRAYIKVVGHIFGFDES